MNRPLTDQELSVVRWLLEHAVIGNGDTYRVAGISGLRVVGGCGCGCSSITFEPDAASERIADAIAQYTDGTQAGLLLWGVDGRLTKLEVYDLDPDASHRFPSLADLRTWGEMAE